MSADNLFEEALRAEGATGDLALLARGIYAQESGSGKNTKTSNRGAVGGMQVTPGAFSDVADKNWSIDDPMHNARAGIRYLAARYKQAGGDPALTAAGYYGGPGGLEKARKGVAVSDPMNPNNPNTLQYAQQAVAKGGLVGAGSRAERVAATPPAAPAVIAARSTVPSGGGVVAPAAEPVVVDAPVVAAAGADVGEAPASSGPSGGSQSNAWETFLASMPKSKAQPVQVADFRFGGSSLPSMQPGQLAPPMVIPAKPHFEAFSGWKAKRA